LFQAAPKRRKNFRWSSSNHFKPMHSHHFFSWY